MFLDKNPLPIVEQVLFDLHLEDVPQGQEQHNWL